MVTLTIATTLFHLTFLVYAILRICEEKSAAHCSLYCIGISSIIGLAINTAYLITHL